MEINLKIILRIACLIKLEINTNKTLQLLKIYIKLISSKFQRELFIELKKIMSELNNYTNQKSSYKIRQLLKGYQKNQKNTKQP